MRKFVQIKHKIVEKKDVIRGKYQVIIVYPDYSLSGKDIMKKGGKFYAVLDHESGMWTTDPTVAAFLIDNETLKYVKSHYHHLEDGYYDEEGREVIPELLDVSSTWRLKEFNLWIQNLSPDHNYTPLDSDITFKSDKVVPEMYRSKRLAYDLVEGDISSYDKMMSVLYTEDNRRKIEWSVGSVLAGYSKVIEKMLVLYGAKGTGKSTILDLIKMMFDGYWSLFVASEIASKNNQFASSYFKDNPLVAIQDDGNLSKIDSPIINEIVSHKEISINEKGKQYYSLKSNAFLFLATNDTVDIHDTRMGIARRLIDVYPTGNKIPPTEFRDLKDALKFELPAIAFHCKEVFEKCGRDYYANYSPEDMIAKTNYLQNFLFDKLDALSGRDFYTRDDLYSEFKDYCEESGLGYPPKRLLFGDQLKEYFDEYYSVKWAGGTTRRHVYYGLKVNKICGIDQNVPNVDDKSSAHKSSWLTFDNEESLFDKQFSDQPAQYANEKGSPCYKWANVKTKLRDLDTHKLHWLTLPVNVIKMDFDKKDKDGNKSLELNIEAAKAFPPTYAEISKSGCGVHLYYVYSGDPNELSRIYEEDVEIKVSTGNSSHRRILTKCNSTPIKMISTGLPLKKGEKSTIDENIAMTEKSLVKSLTTTMEKCMAKGVHGDTRSNIDFIYKILEDAYKSGITYDVTNMEHAVLEFAMNSTNQAEYCVNKVAEMHFKSDEGGVYNEEGYDDNSPFVFFDFEVYPNMNLLCWKFEGPDQPVHRIFNPTPEAIATVFGLGVHNARPKAIGYNNKEYDNHIAYAIWLGKSVYEVFKISQAIIGGEKTAKFREAKHFSYTDIFDYSPEKISLKKWENRLHLVHKEMSLKWDEPVPEELWDLVADYCCNDVLATEAVFHETKPYYDGRLILCDLANILIGPGSVPNDSTNELTTKLIVGFDKNPQSKFVYPNLAERFKGYEYDRAGIDQNRYISKDVIISGKSIYKGWDPGEGGFVYYQPGMYGIAESWDSASHHPSSLIAENGFGEFTPNFKRIMDLRLMVKHKEYDKLRSMYNGALAKYLTSEKDAKALSLALKIAINSVYGLTAAKFPNRLRDPRNVDNWVAKRGALFMIDLMLKVKEMGYTVIHCKTDSIKVLNPDDRVRNFIKDFGKEYGYTFELEHRFERICLVNKAVYVCKYTDEECNGDERGLWAATGKQFQVPYVFKTLFSHEPITFDDKCEMKNATTALYLDMNEKLPEGEHEYVFIGKSGLFCPVKEGFGGGVMYREKDGKYYAAESTKGYRWLEAPLVEQLGLDQKGAIDEGYYIAMVDKAVEAIKKYGDFERFVSDAPYVDFGSFMNVPEGVDDEIPFKVA